MRTFQEFMDIAEGMTMKDFKANRRKLKRKETSADAKKRGHVGKEWYNIGRTYSPDEAKSGRAKMDDEERSTRKRSAIDPEAEDNNYSADKTKNPKKLRKQKAMGELGEEFVEEGIGMTMANALGNPPALSKRMKLKQALIINKIKSDAKKNAGKKYSGKAAKELDENVSSGRTKVRNVKQRVSSAEVITNTEKQNQIAKHFSDHATKKKSAGDEAHSAATKAGKSPMEAETARQRAHRNYERQMKRGMREEYIDETSLNRVRSKSEKGGMAIMSAQRGDKSKKENKARSKQLEKDIRGAGLPGPTKVSGRYTENPGTAQEKKVGEKSHVVSSGKMGKRKFKKAVEKLGKKYDQDSVLIQRKPKGSATIKGTSKTSWPGKGKNVGVGKMKPGRTGEFDTKVKNKTFTYEED